MNLSAKTISFKHITKIDLHPLAKKLYNLMIEAYISGGQEKYLKQIAVQFNCYPSLPIHNVSLISKGVNEYLLIGGCFSPVFNLNELHENNTIFLSYKTSKSTANAEHRKHIDKDFNQDVVDFIFMDFIRSVSLLSLKKPGSIYSELRQITKKYNSEIWHDLFENKDERKTSYLHQKDFAKLLNKNKGTIINQSKL
ncbi:hypothetical protein ACBQ04_12580 [Psychrobacter faecalis]